MTSLCVRRGALALMRGALMTGLLVAPVGAMASEPRASPVETSWEPKEPSRSAWSVSAAGPVVTALGGLTMVGGAVFTTYATGLDECDEANPGCDGRLRFPFMMIGVGASALAGGLTIAIGALLWRNELGRATKEFAPLAPRANVPMLVGGATLMGVGAGMYSLGLYGALASANPRSALSPVASGALLITGALGAAIGVPLMVLGARELPRRQSIPTVGLGPGGLSISGNF